MASHRQTHAKMTDSEKSCLAINYLTVRFSWILRAYPRSVNSFIFSFLGSLYSFLFLQTGGVCQFQRYVPRYVPGYVLDMPISFAILRPFKALFCLHFCMHMHAFSFLFEVIPTNTVSISRLSSVSLCIALGIALGISSGQADCRNISSVRGHSEALFSLYIVAFWPSR